MWMTGSLWDEPVGPVDPELPEVALGRLSAWERASPVVPEFVALDCAVALPEAPVDETGVVCTSDAPPLPPSALLTATLEPPTAVTGPALRMAMLTAGPPGAANAPARPAGPPLPPVATTRTPLPAPPVEPELAIEVPLAPVLAMLIALPSAMAGPVEPEFPELPELADPPMTTVVPNGPVFTTVGPDVADPVAPVLPELPDTATGAENALDSALPVLPVLVELDWAEAEPELPVLELGLTVTLEPPPLPPLADDAATLLPPAAVAGPVPTATFSAGPPGAETASAPPPLPPSPPLD